MAAEMSVVPYVYQCCTLSTFGAGQAGAQRAHNGIVAAPTNFQKAHKTAQSDI